MIKEKGEGAFTIFMMIGIIMFSLNIMLKLYDPYIQYRTINSVINTIVESPEFQLNTITNSAILESIDKRMTVNAMKLPENKPIKIEDTNRGKKIILDYEVRVEGMFNVDFMVYFYQEYGNL